MRWSSLILISLVLAPLPSRAATVKYYFGSVKYDSHHGAPTSALSLVKRTLTPEASRIDELVTEKDEEPGAKAEDFPTLLKRRAGTKTFDLDMEGGYVTGSLTFSGQEEWAWKAWSYDMTMTLPHEEAVRKITGNGIITLAGAIKTTKTIQLLQGENVIRSIDRTEILDEISAEKYAALYRELHSR